MAQGINTQVIQTWWGWGWSGDVVWPALSTDNAIARFDSTTWKLIQNSTATLSDAGLLSTDSVTITTRINAPEIKAINSAGFDIHNNSGTQVALFWAGWSTWASIVWTTNVGSASADYHQLSGWTWTITDTAVGSSTNIDINLIPKWTGKLKVNWVEVALGVNEIEIDFWTTIPVKSKRFTISNWSITWSSKITVSWSWSVATWRVGNDWEWDSINFTALAWTGNFTLTANATWRVKWKRKIFYSFS